MPDLLIPSQPHPSHQVLIAWKYPSTARAYLFTYKNNPLRWAEYSISASLMLVAISILAGVHDVHLWFTMASLNFTGT